MGLGAPRHTGARGRHLSVSVGRWQTHPRGGHAEGTPPVVAERMVLARMSGGSWWSSRVWESPVYP